MCALRIDGKDVGVQLTSHLKPTRGRIRWKWNPRHAAADAVKFGNASSYIMDAWGDASNYIRAYWTAANTVTIAVNAGGAGEQTTTWDATGAIAAGTSYSGEFKYDSSHVDFIVDGATKATITTPIVFTTMPALYPGARQDGTLQGDATFASP